jgi:outer membrane receptor protein involved in Fe transport
MGSSQPSSRCPARLVRTAQPACRGPPRAAVRPIGYCHSVRGAAVAAACWATSASATDAADRGRGHHHCAAATSPATTEAGLEEITVTAERYTSTIQSTPISISALSGDQLTAAGLSRVQDIIKEVPGLSMRYAGPGLTEYEARGLASNGGAAPTVGFYLDEIPFIAAGRIAVRQGGDRSQSLRRRARRGAARAAGHPVRFGIDGRYGPGADQSSRSSIRSKARSKEPGLTPMAAAAMAAAT